MNEQVTPNASEQGPAGGESVSDADRMAEIWDKLSAEPEAPEAPEEPQEAEEPDEAPEDSPEPETEAEPDEAEDDEVEAEPEPVVAPGDLPDALKKEWAQLSETARDAILRQTREANNRLAEQGRVVKAAKPVYDVLVEAAQQLPGLRNMTPDEIARDVMKAAQAQNMLREKPVETLLSIANDYGVLPAIKSALEGQQPNEGAQREAQMAQRIEQLERHIQRISDPSQFEELVESKLSARDAERTVIEYAQGKEYWQDVEADMPAFVQLVQQREPGLPPRDILDRAYDMAIHANPELRAKVTAPPPKAQPETDPKRTEAQLKAKSVNVKSRSSGKSRPMTEEQRLAATYDRLMS